MVEAFTREKIYVLPDEVLDKTIDNEASLPVYPSPEKLKHMFIVKCKRSRLIPQFLINNPPVSEVYYKKYAAIGSKVVVA